jgi:catechol 2,3-dioxygenase-like lactoylglutathione lyase family enzyme
VRGLRLAFAVALLAFAGAVASDGRAEPVVRAVGCLQLTVGSADRAVGFYVGVLAFTRVGEREVSDSGLATLQSLPGLRARIVRLALGRECVELVEVLAPRGRAKSPGERSNDLSFQHMAIVVRDMDAAYRVLRAAHVRQVSSEPQRIPAWNKAAAGIRAFYFRDPDDHNLELIWFPKGKGAPRWQTPSDSLFLGIDHTAIAVSDTARSVAFYRDRLGLRVAGESENSGTEQERLNAVFSSRVRITGLRAAEGPGIELLEYLAPADGRPAPDDLRANDVAYWLTRLRVSGIDTVAPGAIAVDDAENGFRRALVIRDPDGHALRLEESE